MSSENLLQAITAVRTAQDYIKLPGYKGLPWSPPTSVVREYSNEKDFWFEVLVYGSGVTEMRNNWVLHGDCNTMEEYAQQLLKGIS
jgi:hypothetical protein